jgi:hypothetical protein
MDKPEPVLTGSIDEECVDTIVEAAHVYGDDRRVTDLLRTKAEAIVADYRQKIEVELWQAWEIAQGFKFDEDRNRVLHQRNALDELRESFHRAVRRYNRHVIEHHAENPEEEPFSKHEGCSEPECEDCDAEAARKAERAATKEKEETIES